MLFDATEMDGGGLSEGLPTHGRDGGLDATPIGGALGPLHEAGLLHPIHEAGEPALREEDPLGELRHAEPPVRGLVEMKEHLVEAQREITLRLQLSSQRLGHHGVGLEEGAPGGQLSGIHGGHIGIVRE